MRLKAVTVGMVLAGMALGSAALTLGRARGAAWIGQPLELVVPVQLDPGQGATALCAEADVFHADTRQESSRVQVQVEPTAQPDSVNLRVQSSAIVDEPVVTVYLRAGCGQKTTRRYVLLADFPSETAAPAPAPRAPVEPAALPSASTVADAPAGAATPSATAATPAKATKPQAAEPKAIKAPAARAPASTTAPVAERPAKPSASAPAVAKAPAANAGRSRLKLDPLENLTERIKTLEATTTAAPLEEMVRDSQRIQQLQDDVKALLGQAAKNESNLMALRERLEKAESERVPATVVYALVALVLLCLVAIGVLWTRRAQPTEWRSGLPSESDQQTPLPPVTTPFPTEAAVTQTLTPAALTHPITPVPAREDAQHLDVDVNLMDMDEESFGKLLKPQPTQPGALSVAAPEAAKDAQPAPHADFNAESILDIRQQADFFVTLGKTDEAIEVLERRIRENERDTPLLFLDLLRIANVNSLKTDFRQFREEFMNVFNATVPEFALFRNEGRGLEDYPSLLEHIVALWPSPKVLDVIESCVLRDPFEKNAEPFDLAAFRDLILLHGLARQQAFPQDSLSGAAHESTQHVDLDF